MGEDVIVVDSLVKRFGDFTAVKGISFSVREGEIFGFLGSNGSGKSTTIRMLCGIMRPSSGRAVVAGIDVVADPEAVKGSIGYMSQKFSLYEELTPLENIRFFLGMYAVDPAAWEERIRRTLETFNLLEVRDKRVRDLPQGFRQRLALGCSLVHDPKIVFLDEPTSGVDPLTRLGFWNTIRRIADSGVTVFVTTHYMEDAGNCSRIVMINLGEIVAQGTPGEIVASACRGRSDATLEDAFVELMAGRAG